MTIAPLLVALVLQTPAPGQWTEERTKSEMDGRVSLIYSLNVASANSIGEPMLIVRCKDGETDVFVNTRRYLGDHGSLTRASWKHSVRVKFDEGKPDKQNWNEGGGKRLLFAGDAKKTLRLLGAARRFVFEFTPYQSTPIVASFDVTGADVVATEIARACNWKL